MNYNIYFNKLLTRKLIALYDGESTKKILTESGFKNLIEFKKYDNQIPGECFAVLEEYSSLEVMKEWWGKSKSIISHIAATKFDNNIDTIRYTLNNLLNGNIFQALERRKLFYKFIENSNLIEIESRKGKLEIFLSDAIEVANRDETMKEGWIYSIAEFLESSIINIKSPTSSFSISGVMPFSGFIYLCNTKILKTEKSLIKKLNYLLKEASIGKENYLIIKDGEISNIFINGKSNFQDFQDIYNKERFLYPTEFAFGCLTQKNENVINWGINSLINESSYGFHVGIGMGKATPHLDFICPITKEITLKNNNSVFEL